jgi:hypothetical protein
MIKTLCTSEAAEELFRDENANWTRLGAYALVEYFEQLEEDCGTPIEFDRVAIRCDYSEYDSPLAAAIEYNWSPEASILDDDDNLRPEDEVEGENNALALQWLQDRTSVIEFEGGIIIAQF